MVKPRDIAAWWHYITAPLYIAACYYRILVYFTRRKINLITLYSVPDWKRIQPCTTSSRNSAPDGTLRTAIKQYIAKSTCKYNFATPISPSIVRYISLKLFINLVGDTSQCAGPGRLICKRFNHHVVNSISTLYVTIPTDLYSHILIRQTLSSMPSIQPGPTSFCFSQISYTVHFSYKCVSLPPCFILYNHNHNHQNNFTRCVSLSSWLSSPWLLP